MANALADRHIHLTLRQYSDSLHSGSQNTLCDTCLKFCRDASQKFARVKSEEGSTDQMLWPQHDAIIHKNPETLQRAAKNGCLLCKVTLYSLEREINGHRHHGMKPEIRLILALNGQGSSRFPVLSVQIEAVEATHNGPQKSIAWYTKPPEGKLAEVLRQCAIMEDDSTGSDCTFALASHWLADCLKNHSCARQSPTNSSEPLLPTRVIDVGPPDGTVEPRLHITTNQDKGPYVALSHCWGKQPIIRTLKDNFEEHCKRIPMSALSQTFKDAVVATRKLNIRYMWIDSLCIIQDSGEDWSTEAKTMCRVYQNSLLTIAAGHADSGAVGCFVKRDGALNRPFELPFRPHFLDKHEPFDAWFQPMVSNSPLAVAEPPLHTRAWVLQEQVLSPRTLIYEGTSIHWQCMEKHGSEKSPQGGLVRHKPFMKEIRKYLAGKESESETAKWNVPWMHTWRGAVQDYTYRGLTKWSDKLIAIYGIADALQKTFGEEYIAGLWGRDLWMELLWYVPERPSELLEMRDRPAYNTYPTCRPNDYIGPTWSWASVGSALVYYDIALSLTRNCICRVIDVAKDDKANGDGATLTLEADARIAYVRCNYRWSEDSVPGRAATSILESHHPFRRASEIPATSWSPEEDVPPSQPLTFIAIAEAPGDAGFLDREASTVYTLGLVPLDKAKTKYRRVGLGVWTQCSWYGYTCTGKSKGTAQVAGTSKDSGLKNLTKGIAGRLGIAASTTLQEKHKHPMKIDTFLDPSVYRKGVKVERLMVTIV